MAAQAITQTDAAASRGSDRPRVAGKFLSLGGETLYVRGVTYGTFAPDAHGSEFPAPEVVERDFAQMAANGLNAVRVFTAPPRSLLDSAQRHGLRVMVGLSAERNVGFLIDKTGAPDLEEEVRAQVRSCAGHPAVLCYAVGNEIPASMVRWLGRHGVERYLKRLFSAAKAEDPEGLVTYANYPSTEYLQLPFLDFVCFNVYLERRERLEAYLARLQNLAGDRPLVLGEAGLDSRSRGELTQARMLDWQIRTAFEAGCAGAFVFAWTDEWHTGAGAVEDWDFGLTRRDRSPKPALASVRRAFAETPLAPEPEPPRVSVIVCTRNGERTLNDCLEGLKRLEYPNFEVIVVDDGSTDATPQIAEASGFRLISTEQRGLGSARNAGMKAASGEIVAYLDDDAWPEPHWLSYLVRTFQRTEHAAVGGPNLGPPLDGLIADCVANAPGSPTHVLIGDREAEHIPGCNMAFRKQQLDEIDGFDPQFRTAGDDVDVCWRLQERGLTLGFHPGAMVWHARRSSLGAYWRQQRGYGAAEAMLELKWPEKYNAPGHLTWRGHVYDRGRCLRLGRRRVGYGMWGCNLFQSIYEPGDGLLSTLPLMPEWYLLLASLAALSAGGALWSTPLLAALPLLALATAATLAQAAAGARRVSFATAGRSHARRLTMQALTALLYLLQPAARLSGRLRQGLSPWRRRGTGGIVAPRRRAFWLWSEQWVAPYERLQELEAGFRARGVAFRRGGDFDRWDFEVRGGMLGAARALMAVEEHGAGRQLVRLRIWPRVSPLAWTLVLVLGGAALGAIFGKAWPAAVLAGAGGALVALVWLQESGGATASVSSSFEPRPDAESTEPGIPAQLGEGGILTPERVDAGSRTAD
jgi:glycosyltransferase involved in cell wall biosynthesis